MSALTWLANLMPVVRSLMEVCYLMALGLLLIASASVMAAPALLRISASTSLSSRQKALLGLMAVGCALLKVPAIGSDLARAQSTVTARLESRIARLESERRHADAARPDGK